MEKIQEASYVYGRKLLKLLLKTAICFNILYIVRIFLIITKVSYTKREDRILPGTFKNRLLKKKKGQMDKLKFTET